MKFRKMKTVQCATTLLLACISLSTTTTPVFEKYMPLSSGKILIETGTEYGDGVQRAIDAGYNTIYSIEFDRAKHSYCRNRFIQFPNVHLLLGTSEAKLQQLLTEINEPVVFWLDAHHQGESHACGASYHPLLAELDAIARHPIKTHTILIDDVRLFHQYAPNGMATIAQKVYEINPAYNISFDDGYVPGDVLVARVLDTK